MTDPFLNQIKYKNSRYRKEALEIMDMNIKSNHGELCGDIETLSRYIFDLEKRLDKISHMYSNQDVIISEVKE